MSNPTTVQTSRLYGQSIWYDNIRRGLIRNGELKALIERGVLGITSNPTIFEKAISGSCDYDEALAALVKEGKTAEEIYEALAVDDIREACDALAAVFDATDGVDGRVSFEVLPSLASDTTKTVLEAVRLAKLVGRRNVMIKVPGTPEGIPAVRALTAAGISVNVTLIFSLTQYREVLAAYIQGLTDRTRTGQPFEGLCSVASFFVSRVDSVCDKLLEQKMRTGRDDEKRVAQSLLGRIAIANAKLAYEIYEESLVSPTWKGLAALGARPQRLLWASTGTKNPSYPDTLYLDALIGPDTVNTVPPATLDAFLDHGQPAPSLRTGVPEATAQIKALASLGIDLEKVCQDLLSEGVKSFSASMATLLEAVDGRRAALAERLAGRVVVSPTGASVLAAQLKVLDTRKAAESLWTATPTFFTPDPSHVSSIKNRLGWLRAPALMKAAIPGLESFVTDVQKAGYTQAVLLGMGGSSLCPEVMSLSRPPGTRGLPVHVLDNTDPAAVAAIDAAIDLEKTLFIVASKSGGTIEIQAFERHFWDRMLKASGGDVARAGAHFVAITDPGTKLGALATEKKFRHTFVNPADIGGRYSALSYFGLVPAALLGWDLEALLAGALEMVHASGPSVPTSENPGLALGAFVGGNTLLGRDKLTLLASPEIASLGSWIEQLVAESTGKEGRGVIPVDLEPLGAADVYGADRQFVFMRLDDSAGNGPIDALVSELVRLGHPVLTVNVLGRTDLGREFLRWEVATAATGALLAVNPFDEPNVTEAKVATSELLAIAEEKGSLPTPEGVVGPTDVAAVRRLLNELTPADYFTLSAYFVRSEVRDALLAELRRLVRAGRKNATTLGYGPRFLHSTGQLHKGGPNTGVFLQLTASVPRDLAVPGEPWTFGRLRDAQALGDLQVLRKRGRRALRVHLGDDIDGGLRTLITTLAQAVAEAS